MSSLESWQGKQNGTLQRLEDKIDRLMFWLLTSMFGTVAALLGIVAVLITRK